jgi:hypothetical protein
MINKESWDVREQLVQHFHILQSIIDYYKSKFAALEELKTSIIDDPAKKAALKALLDQDADNPMTLVTSKYLTAKANATALVDIIPKV